jgi:hypothetical protein
MARSRNIIRYNSVGLFLTETSEDDPYKTQVSFLNRIQSAEISIDVSRVDVQHIGSEDFLDRKIVSAPEINVSFEYLLTDGYEEKVVGINQEYSPTIYTEEFGVIDNPEPAASGTIHNQLQDNKSLFMVVGEEQFDLTGYANRPQGFSGLNIISIGNCFITNYSVSASVGDMAKANVSMVASNIEYSCIDDNHAWFQPLEELSALLREIDQNDTDFVHLQTDKKVLLEDGHQEELTAGLGDPSLDLPNKGLKKEIGIHFEPKHYKAPISAMPPGAIHVKIRNLDSGGPILNELGDEDCIEGYAHIQTFDVNVPFERENLQGFESMHVYGRKMKYPQIGNISFSILPSAFKNGEISQIFCEDNFYEIELKFNNQCNFGCLPSEAKDTHMIFRINNAKLDGYSLSQSIGSFQAFNCNFSFGVSRNNGVFIYGTYENERLFPCGPTMYSAPRNMTVTNISKLGEKDTPSNIGFVPDPF